MSDQPQPSSFRDSGQLLSDTNPEQIYGPPLGSQQTTQLLANYPQEDTPVRNEELPPNENAAVFSDSRIGESFPWKQNFDPTSRPPAFSEGLPLAQSQSQLPDEGPQGSAMAELNNSNTSPLSPQDKDTCNNSEQELNDNLAIAVPEEPRKQRPSRKGKRPELVPEYQEDQPIKKRNRKSVLMTDKTSKRGSTKGFLIDGFAGDDLQRSVSMTQTSESNNFNKGRWQKEEHVRFLKALKKFKKEWKKVQEEVKTRSSTQARSHAQKFFNKLDKKGLKLDEYLETLDEENIEKDCLMSDLEEDADPKPVKQTRRKLSKANMISPLIKENMEDLSQQSDSADCSAYKQMGSSSTSRKPTRTTKLRPGLFCNTRTGEEEPDGPRSAVTPSTRQRNDCESPIKASSSSKHSNLLHKRKMSKMSVTGELIEDEDMPFQKPLPPGQASRQGEPERRESVASLTKKRKLSETVGEGGEVQIKSNQQLPIEALEQLRFDPKTNNSSSTQVSTKIHSNSLGTEAEAKLLKRPSQPVDTKCRQSPNDVHGLIQRQCLPQAMTPNLRHSSISHMPEYANSELYGQQALLHSSLSGQANVPTTQKRANSFDLGNLFEKGEGEGVFGTSPAMKPQLPQGPDALLMPHNNSIFQLLPPGQDSQPHGMEDLHMIRKSSFHMRRDSPVEFPPYQDNNNDFMFPPAKTEMEPMQHQFQQLSLEQQQAYRLTTEDEDPFSGFMYQLPPAQQDFGQFYPQQQPRR